MNIIVAVVSVIVSSIFAAFSVMLAFLLWRATDRLAAATVKMAEAADESRKVDVNRSRLDYQSRLTGTWMIKDNAIPYVEIADRRGLPIEVVAIYIAIHRAGMPDGYYVPLRRIDQWRYLLTRLPDEPIVLDFADAPLVWNVDTSNILHAHVIYRNLATTETRALDIATACCLDQHGNVEWKPYRFHDRSANEDETECPPEKRGIWIGQNPPPA